ncbi:MAG: ComF family protein [Dechloromonas sp.]|uniref:ComF family protein n=1 Tax=Candidatus Dechloromonas phosphorivorans TaxID=2899244 RepID=A0A9D7LNZ0_9RHOO|nr:ComF family protein [Candidatus Dechloromonas phosphorivorans]
MSILPQPLRTALNRVAAHLLPGSCLLCAADSGSGLLCPACASDLPRLPAALCPQCGDGTTLGERCGACLKDPPAFARTVALFRYEFPVDRLIQALKYGHQLPLAAWFGARLSQMLAAADYDLVLPLPLHPSRLRTRGFNQSLEIARPVARALGLPIDPILLTRTRATPPQADLPFKERARNVRGAFECAGDLAGRRILLVDDVMTTGSTLREAARILKLHSAGQITVAIAARALRR